MRNIIVYDSKDGKYYYMSTVWDNEQIESNHLSSTWSFISEHKTKDLARLGAETLNLTILGN